MAVLDAAGSNLRELLGLYRRAAGWFVFALRASALQTVLALAGWAKTTNRDYQFQPKKHLAAA